MMWRIGLKNSGRFLRGARKVFALGVFTRGKRKFCSGGFLRKARETPLKRAGCDSDLVVG